MNSRSEQLQKVSFFLFVNTKSGGGVGRKYLTIPNRRLNYKFQKYSNISLHFVDLFSSEEREKAITFLNKLVRKNLNNPNHSCKVVICGGDGTVLWVVSLLSTSGVNMDKIAFCIIPIGTGNDFSRCLGWGGSPLRFSSDNLLPLKQRILEWLEASQSWYDIWQAKVSTYEDGTIIQIRDRNEVDTGLQVLQRGMCNYFSIGIDARICYSVEKRRQNNKLLNLALYGCIGLCKWFQKIRPTHEAVEAFREDENTLEDTMERKEEKTFGRMKEKQNSANQAPLLEKNDNVVELKQGYGNLLALNSVRYMAGLQNVWNTSKLGIKTEQPPNFTEQRFDDGKLEFVGFKSQLGLGLQRFINCASRVAQGQGPFTINFRRTDTEAPTFIHLDGEAMKIRQLKEVVIKKSALVEGSQIRVLVKRTES